LEHGNAMDGGMDDDENDDAESMWRLILNGA
jgi:hypothetical protein